MAIFQSIKKYSEDPKSTLEILLLLSSFTIGYFYIYVYQNMLHISVIYTDIKDLMKIGFIDLVIAPLIYFIVIKADPLQRSKSERKAIKFFQNWFPSKYIKDRCGRCAEDEKTCSNHIEAGSGDEISYWFGCIFPEIEKGSPGIRNQTLRKGYTCKLLYNLIWVIVIFSLLAIVTIVLHHVYLYLSDKFRIDLVVWQIFFPLILLFAIILIKALNSPNESSPSGCWQAWREINQMHIFWLRHHEDFLVGLICRASGGTKRFKAK